MTDSRGIHPHQSTRTPHHRLPSRRCCTTTTTAYPTHATTTSGSNNQIGISSITLIAHTPKQHDRLPATPHQNRYPTAHTPPKQPPTHSHPPPPRPQPTPKSTTPGSQPRHTRIDIPPPRRHQSGHQLGLISPHHGRDRVPHPRTHILRQIQQILAQRDPRPLRTRRRPGLTHLRTRRL